MQFPSRCDLFHNHPEASVWAWIQPEMKSLSSAADVSLIGNSRSSWMNISVFNLISTSQVSSVRLLPGLEKRRVVSVPYCIPQYGKWLLDVLEAIRPILKECAVHIASGNFWSQLRWMRLTIFPLWFVDVLGPRSRLTLFQLFLHRQILYIYSSTITWLAHPFIQTKNSFGHSGKLEMWLVACWQDPAHK